MLRHSITCLRALASMMGRWGQTWVLVTPKKTKSSPNWATNYSQPGDGSSDPFFEKGHPSQWCVDNV